MRFSRSPWSRRSLEIQLERQHQAARQRGAREIAVVGIGLVVVLIESGARIDGVVLGVIERVVAFEAELQPSLVIRAKAEVLEQREVPIIESGAVDRGLGGVADA